MSFLEGGHIEFSKKNGNFEGEKNTVAKLALDDL